MVLSLRLRWPRFVAIALLICCSAASAQKLSPIPSATVRVNDNASMLTETQEASLDASFDAYARANRTRFVLLTVASTAPEQVETYGERVAEAWKIGQPDGAGDILMVIARDNRGDLHRVTIEVAGDRKPLVTDLLVSRIIAEDMLPRFQYLDYNGGVTAAFDRLKTLLAGGVMPPPAVPVADVDAPPRTSYADIAKLGGALALALLGLWFLRATRRRMTYLAGDRAINRAFSPMIVGSFIGRKHAPIDEHNGFGGGYVGPGVGGYAGGGGDFSGGSASGKW